MAKTVQTKQEREKAMVSEMIVLYCRKQHGIKGGLCADCEALNTYARECSDKCPFMETKKDDWRIVMKLKKMLLVIIGYIGVGLISSVGRGCKKTFSFSKYHNGILPVPLVYLAVDPVVDSFYKFTSFRYMLVF